MLLTTEDRLQLLDRYMSYEPEIVVNCEPYIISAQLDDAGVFFYAVSKWNQSVGAIALLSKNIWESCNVGLTMALFYDRILSTLERRILAI